MPQSLISLIDKLSQPCDLFGSRFVIIAKMSVTLISRDERDFSIFSRKKVTGHYFQRGALRNKYLLKRLFLFVFFQRILK